MVEWWDGLKIGALYELNEETEFCPVNIVDGEAVCKSEDDNNNIIFSPGTIVTVLYYKLEQHPYRSGGYFYWHIFHVLYDNQIWYSAFSGYSIRMKEVELE